uniref:MFS domain-containing protein n=1 Tax=Rhabditophanes sp. KR3021 TaxID=114890 RepID=A0AC35UFL4_9BILA
MVYTHNTHLNSLIFQIVNNTFADNTYGNWIAILTGLRGTWSTEFPLELKDDWSMWFDSYPFIWQQFNSQGYATFFAEDRADIATLNYMGKLFGFKTQPTDYYFRPFWIDVEERINFKQSKFGCYQGQINTKIQLDYLSQFLDIYKDKKKFVWWWSTEMSHDSFNAISSMDDIYLNFLKQNEKKLENSVVVLFSDHGNRYDSIRETIVGRYENRMPFLGVKLPKSLNEFNPELIKMMKANSQKMTTQFDLHAFLNSLLNKEWDTKVSERRAYSLLHEHPNNRTCLNAQIPATYCPCNQEIILSVDQAQDAINVLMRLLNEKLKNFSNFIKNDKKYKCMPFSLKEVSYVSLTVPSSSILIDQQTGGKDLPKNINVIYRIMLQMASPSNALIEALLEKNLGTGFVSWRSRRFHVVILLMMGITFFVFSRTHLSITMICMVNSTAINSLSKSHYNSPIEQRGKIESKCLAADINQTTQSIAIVESSGQFVWPPYVQHLIFSASFWGAFISILIGGVLADRTSPKNLCLIAAIGYAICSATFPYLAQNYGHYPVVLSRFVMGVIGEGVLPPSANAILSAWIPNEEKGIALAFFTTGVQLSSIFGVPVAAHFCDNSFLGWQSVFYLCSFCLLVWVIPFYFLIENSPRKARWLGVSEREFLKKKLKNYFANKTEKRKIKVQWMKLFKSPAFLSLLFCKFVANIYNTFTTIYLPSFYKETLYVDVISNGFMSSVPFVFQVLFKIGAGYVSKELQVRNILSSTQAVKICQLVSGIGVTIGFFMIPFVIDCERPYITVILVTFVSSCFGVSASGFLTSSLTIVASSHIGKITAISQFISIIGRILTPFGIIFLKKESSSQTSWNLILITIGSMWLLASITFAYFGNAEEIEFDQTEDKDNDAKNIQIEEIQNILTAA